MENIEALEITSLMGSADVWRDKLNPYYGYLQVTHGHWTDRYPFSTRVGPPPGDYEQINHCAK